MVCSDLQRRETAGTEAIAPCNPSIAAEKALETLVAIAGDISHPRSLQAAYHLLAMANISAPANPQITLDEVRVDQLMGFT